MTIDFENILDVSEELLEMVRKWRNSTSVSQYMMTNHDISPEEHRRWIENLKTKATAKAWAIRFDGRPIGLVSLTNINLEEKTAEWGFYIADESTRGKGIGSAVLYQLLEYAFETLKLRSLSTSVMENNPNALHLYEKFGFEIDPTEQQSLLREGRLIEVVTMELSRGTWVRKRKSLQKEIKQETAAPLS
jgi:UDP-4-amino-4,6-dideoxy-N-acetyl-beta-L-altrosamine N-acetyltransferase